MDRSRSSSVMSSSVRKRSRLLLGFGVAVLGGANSLVAGGSGLSSVSDSGMKSL